LPDDVREHLEAAARLHEEIEAAREARAREQEIAADMLVRQGYSLRDVGAVMGFAHQRAHQLVDAYRARAAG